MQGAPKEALGQSEAFLAFSEAISRVAKIDRPVLILGERGTGKELAVSRLHYLSPRWQGPLVTLNCGALSPTLIEAELFGHEAGAFTGAQRRRAGRFEAAQGGTLFLDEIGNTPLTVQEKILRVVEYGVFERVGSSRPVQVDVRIVAATNADLTRLVRRGRFKPDLLDRLSFEVLVAPPLRRRQGDILLLATHFAARMAFELGRDQVPRFSERALETLLSHSWPGNVRELKNVVERAVYRSDSDLIDEVILDPFAQAGLAPETGAERTTPTTHRREPGPEPLPPGLSLKAEVAALEIDLVRRALAQAQFNQRRAARLLGLTYHQLRGLIRKHQLTPNPNGAYRALP